LRRAHLRTADYLQDQFTPEGETNFSKNSIAACWKKLCTAENYFYPARC
jgi:hypothetical protein